MVGSKTRLFNAIVGLGLAALPAATACGGSTDDSNQSDGGAKDGSASNVDGGASDGAGDVHSIIQPVDASDAGDAGLATDSGQEVDATFDDGGADAAADAWNGVPIK